MRSQSSGRVDVALALLSGIRVLFSPKSATGVSTSRRKPPSVQRGPLRKAWINLQRLLLTIENGILDTMLAPIVRLRERIASCIANKSAKGKSPARGS